MFLQRSLVLAVATASCALALLVGTTARAAERELPAPVSETAWTARPLALHGVFMLPGGPTGLMGGEVDYAPSKNVGLTAGVGAGYLLGSHGWTPRYALGARYRLPFSERFALGAGATFSTGKYVAKDFTFDDQDGEDEIMELDHALWAGVQLSFEWRMKGFSMKILSGVELLLNGGAADCYRTDWQRSGPREPLDCSDMQPLGAKTVFLSPIGTAIGYAF